MTAAVRPGGEPETIVERWRVFWFLPEAMTTLGVVRIAFGVLMVGWTLSLLPNLDDLFGEGSVVPRPPADRYAWGVLEVLAGAEAILVVWGILLVASIALTVGWHSRLAALAVFVGVVTFQRGDPFAFNSGDALIRLEALFLLLAPSGAALSLDRRRTAGSFWSVQVRAPWVLRLMQVQMTCVYVFSVLNKLSGDTWREGTAVSYALQMTDMATVAVPDWITNNALAMNAATWGVLATEVAVGLLVWNRRARPWVLGAGVLAHVMIALALAVAFFSFAMFVLYLAFVPSGAMQRWVDRLEHRSRVPEPAAHAVLS